jgi:D-mannonate dehydratase
MDYAIKKLKQDEIVLMKKIKSLQDGKPKWAASKQLDEIRSAIQLLERYNDISEQDIENEDEYLKQIFEVHPAKAKA